MTAQGEHPLLAEAVALHQAGRLQDAAVLYRTIIAERPTDFDATHLLGVVELQEGRLAPARELISAALRIRPRDSAARSNLGTVHLRAREYTAALEQFEHAVRAQPKSAGALINVGLALRQLGRPREALAPLRRAHAVNSRSAMVCNLLGACLLDTGEALEAVKLFEAATVAEPDEVDGWSNLAIALNRIGDQSRAFECADRAVALQPSSSAAVAALAAVQFEEGRIEESVATYREAAALPDPSAQTLCAFGNALWTSGRCAEAFATFRQALAVDPDNVVALWKLAMSQCQPFYETEEQIEISRRAFAAQLGELGRWFDAAPRPEAFAAVGSTQPFFLAYQAHNNRALLSSYGRLCVDWMTSLHSPRPVRRAIAGRKLRIGVASAHIRDHSVWNAITKGWIDNLDPARFEVWLFHLGRGTDDETARARLAAAHFDDAPRTLPEWIRAIEKGQLDVLIYPDIGMDALTTQLASLRLALVQAAAWGHPETTGLPTIDFYISAEGLEPLAAEGNYSERLIRLPHLGVFVEPLAPSIVEPDLAALGLPSDEPLLLCPGTPFKYSPVHDRVWARIAQGLESGGRRGLGGLADRLRGRKNGRLVFFRSGNDGMDALLAGRLRRAFDAERVDFDGHVHLIQYLPRAEFFGLMRRSTLLLDTIGFSGFNNALQAIEVGLPVLAFEGEFMRGRLASAVMRRMELPELIAASTEQFIQTAVRLALDESRCGQLRMEIAARRAVLFKDSEPVRALERWLSEAVTAAQSAPTAARK